MSLASVEAFADLWGAGIISSGAVMVPCPWFLKAVEFARANPQADLGVHITLTSEWKTYRWGPISTRDPRSGMIDEEGFFYPRARLAGEHGEPEYVLREMECQVQRAIDLGMAPTHMDTHMGAVAHEKFIRGYLQTALRHRLPPMIFRMNEAGWMARGLDAKTAAMAVMLAQMVESAGLPLLDHLVTLELDQPENRLDQAKSAFAALEPGITHFIIHPSKDLPELREITPDWRARVADYETFMNEELAAFLRSIGVNVIGYRAIQQLMPEPAALGALPL
jgi:predicted glycoside hydrolase/deacetylase ChbG (UPF0249 family)